LQSLFSAKRFTNSTNSKIIILTPSLPDQPTKPNLQEPGPDRTNVKAGIVIVSFNASLAVRVTLASLGQAANKTAFEVILIDNASDGSQRKAIRKAFDQHVSESRLTGSYIQSEENLGFAGGNNLGIKAFLNDPAITHVCLLNSDVIVSDYWLDRLVATKCPIVSPVTNKANSEQCVPVDYQVRLDNCLDPETGLLYDLPYREINDFSQRWNKTWQGNLARAEVTFFCVLLTRELIDRVGFLDENFYPGGYEDDDYCARVLACGIEIFLARDVFMHHFGSASFGNLQENYFNEKASKNREYLEKKYNFSWQSRYEKPIVSYAQDLAWALKGKGNNELQLRYHPVYTRSVTQLTDHFEKEFESLRRILENNGQPAPEVLQQAISSAAEYGKISESWIDILSDINSALEAPQDNEQRIRLIEEDLARLSGATHKIADCNIAMVEYLLSIDGFGSKQGQTYTGTGKGRLRKMLWLMRKGSSFLLQPKGIVFFAGYPYPEREKDGYFQRIRSIDGLAQHKSRVYVDYGVLPGQKSWFDEPALNVLVLHMHNHRYARFMRILVKLLVLRHRTIYFHSVLRMEDGKFGSLMKWPGLNKTIDIHGTVPEEFRYHNDFYSGRLYDKHENLAIKKADQIIVVSHAMHHYLQQKYGEILAGSRVIALPVFPDIPIGGPAKPYINGKPVLVYAGGTHKWQQVPKMIDAIAATRDSCIHKFFCPNPSEVRPLFPKSLRNHPNITIDSKSFNELLDIYRDCHYGFILREDIIVNHAACPTKLVEYMAMGIVPIVDNQRIGDFMELGMQFVPLKDLVSGDLPTEAARNDMARANYRVYYKLMELNRKGKETLQQSLEPGHPYRNPSLIQRMANNLVLSARQSVARVLPRESFFGRATRKNWRKLLAFNSAYIKPLLKREPPIKDQLSTLPACEILMQTGDFIMGGLENVILDQIAVLRQTGKSVALIVLGRSGPAVDRAREQGVPMVFLSYSPEAYRQVLNKMSPKLVIGHYSIEGADVCHRLGIRFVQVIHNTYMWLNDEQVTEFASSAKDTTAFVAVSEYARDYSIVRLGIPAEKCLVVANGIDLDRFKRTGVAKEREILRIKHGLADKDFVFLSVGAVTHQKNHAGTVHAFHKILADCPEARLVILGRDSEKQLFQELETYIACHNLEKYIILAGASTTPWAYYAMADAFVHSAFFEGGQLSLLEAVAANLPVATSEVGFSKHFKGRQGFYIVPPAVDIISFRGSIVDLHSNPEFERNMADQLQKLYTERIPPNLPEKYLRLLDKHFAYKQFGDLLQRFLSQDGLPETPVESWPDIITADQPIQS
jgi:glycosyltransferase involved in cell wall biosynthesis/GT2 family glycosyltransferase